VQALRRFGGDRYVVPSDSMQPVLNGDSLHGDVVFVDKTALASRRVPGDLVVVEHPERPQQQVVKRLAARGDVADECCIDILDGDIWLGADRQRMRRVTKDPLAARSMRVPWASWPGASEALDLQAAAERDGERRLPPIARDAASVRVVFDTAARRQRRLHGRMPPSGFAGTSRHVDASYLDVDGKRGVAGDDVGVRDCGMDLELAAPVAALLCTIDAREDALTFHWEPATGRVVLWRDGRDVAEGRVAHRPHGSHRVEFGLLDDRAFFAVDGRDDSLWVVPRRPEWRPEDGAGALGGPRTWVHVGALGSEDLRIARLAVFHDVFSWRERIAGMPGDPGLWPRDVAPGTWFLLGDNPFDSRDSRHFGPVPCSSFLGRPLLVLGPWPRCRWLP
jgi:hypothetical protein